MDPYSDNSLRIDVNESRAGVLSLVWTGRSEARDISLPVLAYVERAFAEAVQRGLSVELRFERLRYVSSSTLTTFVRMFRSAERIGVTVHVVYDGNSRWQLMSFQGLERLVSKFGDTAPRITFVRVGAASR